VLDASYVDYLLERMKEDGIRRLPSAPIAFEAFRTLGSRPEEMLKALRLMASRAGLDEEPDRTLPIVAATLRGAAADVELTKVEEMGGLANAVFDRIASDGDVARGIFSAEALAGYAGAVGRDVRPDEVQTVLNTLVQANLVIRPGHGLYGISDPFVREIWRERKTLLASG
jgi:hypothetical protein